VNCHIGTLVEVSWRSASAPRPINATDPVVRDTLTITIGLVVWGSR
jgi:hypothetical protein